MHPSKCGYYGETFALYENMPMNQRHERVLRWRSALTQVANFPGWLYSDSYTYEFEFINKIVEDLWRKLGRVPLHGDNYTTGFWRKLGRAPLHNADYTVGLDPLLGKVLQLLELESPKVLVAGIYGVGGIGKTTLARAVYNVMEDQFNASCFLSNVRENSIRLGLVQLQTMLLFELTGSKDIQLENVSQGVSEIKRMLQRKKVLLILDDVDALEQLEALAGGLDWFGPRSRVIVTTRNRHLIAFHQVVRIYELQELNRIDALQLVSHMVFQQGIVDPRYKELLNRAVNIASGLPLALKVIGSSLYGRSVDQCKYLLDLLERRPHNNICFKGYELTDVEDILCARYGHSMKYHIEVLIDKSLINISLDGKVTTHPLIEDMGKEIVRQESPQDPGSRSRLWFPEDTVEIIHLDSHLTQDEEAIEWDGMAFEKMPNLRILIIRKCHFSKAPKYLPDSLKVLEWWRYSSEDLPSDFDSDQLVICKLPTPESLKASISFSLILYVQDYSFEF